MMQHNFGICGVSDGSFRLLEHTADMGIEAHGATSKETLISIACGLAFMIYGDSPARMDRERSVSVTADEPAELLVAWLNEVVYWCERDNLVPAGFRIISFSGKELQAVIGGETFDPQRHMVERMVKSVTYHQACLKEHADGWYARVYVDL